MSCASPTRTSGVDRRRALDRIDRRVAHVAHRAGRDLAPDRRGDDAGMHRVAADVVGGMLQRHRLGQQPHAALGRRIGREARRAAQARDRRHQHDRAAAGASQRRDGVLDRQEHAVEVDRLLALPVGERHGLDRRHDADAGIGDHDVEAAKVLLGLGDHARPRRLVAHVVMKVARLAARLGDALDDALAQRVVDIGDQHRRALARQRLGTGLANARSAAGDDGGLARDLAHQRPLKLPARFSA